MKGLSKTPPKFLDRTARAEWVRIYPMLEEVDTGALDLASVVAYCQCYSYLRTAQEHLAADGLIITTRGNLTQINPWHSIYKQQAELLKKLVAELGFSVAARRRLGIDAPTGRSGGIGDLV